MAKIKFGFIEGGGQSGGYTLAQGTIHKILKQKGDPVTMGDVIALAETDKASLEIRAPVSGVIAEMGFKEGDEWNRIGEETCGTDLLYLPELGEIETEAEALERIGGDGIISKELRMITEAETMWRSDNDEHGILEKGIQTTARESGVENQNSGAEKIPRAVPAARYEGRKLGVSLSDAQGAGPDGVIQTIDIIRLAKKKEECDDSRDAIVKPSAFHLEMARRVELSKKLIPHAGDKTVHADVTALWNCLEKLNGDGWLRARGFIFRIEYLIGYFAVELLMRREFQILNSYWDFEKKYIVVIPRINIGFTVDATNLDDWGDERLGMPIVHDAGVIPLLSFVKTAEAGITRALSRKLLLSDDRELTFTINNTGVLGGVAPDSVIPITKDEYGKKDRLTGMILNIGAMEDLPDGHRKISFSFRFDHRLSGGKRVMAFANAIVNRVESIKNHDDFLRLCEGYDR